MIAARLVPKATDGSKSKIRHKTGTMKTPPPTPTIAAIIPTKNAMSGSRITSKRNLPTRIARVPIREYPKCSFSS